MRNFKSVVLIDRYMEEIRQQIYTLEQRVQALGGTGSDIESDRARLAALKRSLAALQFRAENVGRGRL